MTFEYTMDGLLITRNNVYGESFWRMKRKVELYQKNRKICTPNSTFSTDDEEVKVHEELPTNNNNKCPQPSVPLSRQKTAVLSRRNTLNGKIPVDCRYLTQTKQPRVRCRPKRSVSDESTISNYSSSVSSVPLQFPFQEETAYEKALHNLSKDERWQKEMTLGTRVGLYRLYRDLGKGNFSKVKVAVHYLTKEKVAVKIIDKSKLHLKTRRMLAKEVSVMESIRHPHIIRLYEVLDTASKLYLAMEFAEGGELFYKITTGGRIPEEDAKIIFAQVTSAVIHMHKHNIIHRDLKAENVFIAGLNLVKIGDFGFSTHVHNPKEALATFCGSPPYAAPELFQSECYLGPSVDLWSLGVLLYLTVTAMLPFKGETLVAVKKQVLSGMYTIPKHVSPECTALIAGLLQPSPEKRFTTNQIKSCQWIKGAAFPEPLNEKHRAYIAAERETKQILMQMGITEEILNENAVKGAHNRVNGTYNITMHRLEKLNEGEVPKQHGAMIKKVMSCPKLKSKACSIM